MEAEGEDSVAACGVETGTHASFIVAAAPGGAASAGGEADGNKAGAKER